MNVRQQRGADAGSGWGKDMAVLDGDTLSRHIGIGDARPGGINYNEFWLWQCVCGPSRQRQIIVLCGAIVNETKNQGVIQVGGEYSLTLISRGNTHF